MAGRPTDCTPETIAKFCEAIGNGLYFEQAAVRAGISKVTAYKWLERGESGEEPFATFVNAFKEAEAKAQEDALNEIRNAPGGKDAYPWQSRAWFLERRWPKQYGRTVQEVEHTGTVTTVRVELPSIPVSDPEERRRLMLEQAGLAGGKG